MMFHRFLTIAAVVLLVGLLVSGCGGGGGGSTDPADFEGEWEGTLSSGTDTAEALPLSLSLWMEGNALHGTISNTVYDGVELDHVSVSGTKLSFHVPYAEGNYAVLKGTLSGGDTISGTWEDHYEDEVDHGTWEVERDTQLRVRSTETRPKPAHAAGSGKGFLGTK
ncbi:MAG: hypothetical protein ABFE08_11505 [Armatimonadia bacterium]